MTTTLQGISFFMESPKMFSLNGLKYTRTCFRRQSVVPVKLRDLLPLYLFILDSHWTGGVEYDRL